MVLCADRMIWGWRFGTQENIRLLLNFFLQTLYRVRYDTSNMIKAIIKKTNYQCIALGKKQLSWKS